VKEERLRRSAEVCEERARWGARDMEIQQELTKSQTQVQQLRSELERWHAEGERLRDKGERLQLEKAADAEQMRGEAEKLREEIVRLRDIINELSKQAPSPHIVEAASAQATRKPREVTKWDPLNWKLPTGKVWDRLWKDSIDREERRRLDEDRFKRAREDEAMEAFRAAIVASLPPVEKQEIADLCHWKVNSGEWCQGATLAEVGYEETAWLGRLLTPKGGTAVEASEGGGAAERKLRAALSGGAGAVAQPVAPGSRCSSAGRRPAAPPSSPEVGSRGTAPPRSLSPPSPGGPPLPQRTLSATPQGTPRLRDAVELGLIGPAPGPRATAAGPAAAMRPASASAPLGPVRGGDASSSPPPSPRWASSAVARPPSAMRRPASAASLAPRSKAAGAPSGSAPQRPRSAILPAISRSERLQQRADGLCEQGLSFAEWAAQQQRPPPPASSALAGLSEAALARETQRALAAGGPSSSRSQPTHTASAPSLHSLGGVRPPRPRSAAPPCAVAAMSAAVE